ncbi:hypothetical protein [Microvirga brassicacearum]|uniref:Energy transducer TonB n=1 Tax=Microvirga brassicacearum TaxID=2580413 RepID=A0A5N3P782_9HYPH|nr:hypothetical protein [Microvirga brassicacearum]KAB0265545.1 hypothetical protein FEZ63_17895 [Microvirga brassicacearum]
MKANAGEQAKESTSKLDLGARPQKLDLGDIKTLPQEKRVPPAQPTSGSTPAIRAEIGAAYNEEIAECWNVLPWMRQYKGPDPLIQIRLKNDGWLSEPPKVLNAVDSDPDMGEIARNAIYAITKCQPFKIAGRYANYYAVWKVVNTTFSTRGD